MIRYALTCPDNHSFDSWFRSAEAFDGLRAAGHLACPVCGSGAVRKALMAPAVSTDRQPEAALPAPGPQAPAAPPAAGRGSAPLRAVQSELEAALAALRRQVEENSDYVGMNFAAEARAMHEGDAPARPIHGEARPEDARRLIEDGVPVAPLPFLPRRKTN